MRQFSHQGFRSFYLLSLFLAALHFPLPSPLFSQNKQNKFLSLNIDVGCLGENLLHLSR